MSYKVTFDGNDYYVEAHANRGFRGTYYDPPEPRTVALWSMNFMFKWRKASQNSWEK